MTSVQGGVARSRAWLVKLILLLCGYFTLADVYRLVKPFYAPDWASYSFYDFRLFRAGVDGYAKTGHLYHPETIGFFLPGSRTYKFPPPFAAVLRPFVGMSQEFVGRLFFYGNVVMLAASLFLLLRALRLPRLWAFVSILVFAVWKPTWESLSDLQMEPLLLLCLVISFVLLRKQRLFLAGLGIGVAGAFKIYPWFLLSVFAVRRRWTVLAGAAAGVVGTLVLTSLVIPPRVSVEYFGRILPHLGGTSLAWVNVSMPANLARVGLLISSGLPSAEAIDPMYIEAPGLEHARVIGTVLLLLALGAAGFVFRRKILRGASSSAGPDVEMAAGICLMLLLIPTSWLNYQTLLVVPLLLCAAGIAGSPRDRVNWGLFGACLVLGCVLYSYDSIYEKFPEAYGLIRTCMPFLVLVVLGRLSRREERSALR